MVRTESRRYAVDDILRKAFLVFLKRRFEFGESGHYSVIASRLVCLVRRGKELEKRKKFSQAKAKQERKKKNKKNE